jgi:arsenite oxidase small subunit
MKRCNAMVDASRRKFLTGAGVVAAGAAASAVPGSDTKAAPAENQRAAARILSR